jgi:hypothetical protein
MNSFQKNNMPTEVVMKKLIAGIVLVAVALAFISINIFAQAKTPQYIGAAKCKMCHISKKRGAQYTKWQAGPHASAMEVLKSDEAKAVAKKAGLDCDPAECPKCLKCHVTAFDAPASAKAATFSPDEGVGCEACHGPGSLYKSMKVMKALAAGTQDAKAVAFLAGDKKTCLTCHNEESPTYKPFDYEKAWGEIAHPVPES